MSTPIHKKSSPQTARPKPPRRTSSLALLFSIARPAFAPRSQSQSRHAAMHEAQTDAIAACVARYRAENPTALDEELQRVVEDTLCSGLEAAEDHAEQQYGSPVDDKRPHSSHTVDVVPSLTY